MLTLDPFRKANPQLKLLAGMIFAGLAVLAVGLWWLQIVKRKDYQMSLETQSYRTVRIPAMRGRILDRNGELLAESRPSYNLNLYLDEIRPLFGDVYDQLKPGVLASLKAQREAYEARVNRKLTSTERNKFRLQGEMLTQLNKTARYLAASNLVAQVAATLKKPLTLDPEKFDRHYRIRRAMPMPILADMTPEQVALFSESNRPWPGLEIEVQPVRIYPQGKLASHIIGHLKYDDSSARGEDAFFDYRLPDYRGIVGIEYGYDAELRGHAGAKSMLVNNFGYRFEDAVLMPAEAGQNVILTIDASIQQAAEEALQKVATIPMGAIVVMDVRNGDILAMASSPGYDPNTFVGSLSQKDVDWIYNEEFRPAINRATQENYAPGSIFKPIVGLAALEHGLNPKKKFSVIPDPRRPGGGVIHVGRRSIHDTATPGNDYDFNKALKRSSNTYFITNGLDAGIQAIIGLGEQLHLGESTGLKTRQETSGIFPDQKRLDRGWAPGDTANICIGQGEIAVTPLQMAVMTSAIANGGTVYWPRLVKETTSADPLNPKPIEQFPSGRVRDHLNVHPVNLQIVRDAMLGDVEDPDGTGRAAAIPGVRICGKTGTADIEDASGRDIGNTTWFSSFAPYENPQYAVVIMVEGGSSGGGTCAPLARGIYHALFPESPEHLAGNN